MRVLSCLCCDGICGPQHGCNCTPCQKLDEEETARTTAMVEKTMPAKKIIDLWLWGLQPCKHVYVNVLFIFYFKLLKFLFKFSLKIFCLIKHWHIFISKTVFCVNILYLL